MFGSVGFREVDKPKKSGIVELEPSSPYILRLEENLRAQVLIWGLQAFPYEYFF
jgi:hypothetical protein